MKVKPGIIGPGRLGNSLYRALVKSGYKNVMLFGRNDMHHICELIDSSDIIFICTNDDEIKNVCQYIDKNISDLRNKTFIHFSGLKTSDVFEPLRKKGAIGASFHPLTTFATKESEDALCGIVFGFEGDECGDVMKHILKDYDPRIISITKAQKTCYHAAAVISSNLLCALLDISDKMLKEIGLTEGITLHKALIQTAVNNVFKDGTHNALTGPAKRGDLVTIKDHLAVLSSDEKSIYIFLTLRALKMAASNDPYNEKKYSVIEKELIDNLL